MVTSAKVRHVFIDTETVVSDLVRAGECVPGFLGIQKEAMYGNMARYAQTI